MKLSINKWCALGFLFTVGVGTLLHFVYEWSGKMALVAPFSNVNESTWEHMKLLFYPAFLFAIIQSFFFEPRKDYWFIKLKGTLLGLVLIPVIFYLFNGIIGESNDVINIAIFVISVTFGESFIKTGFVVTFLTAFVTSYALFSSVPKLIPPL